MAGAIRCGHSARAAAKAETEAPGHPSGNGIAARALIRAGYLLAETRWLEAAERTLRAAWLAIDRFPHGHMSLLEALHEYLEPPEIVIIRGAEADRWRDGAGPRW